MLDAWDRPDRLRATARRAAPGDAEDELHASCCRRATSPEVIGDTLAKVCSVDYPAELLEVIVICQKDDPGTIEAVQPRHGAHREAADRGS